MPDIPDLLHTPLPDRAHEALRLAVVAAVDSLTEQVERIDDTYLLLLAAVGGMQGSLNVSQSGQAAITALGQQMAALNTRLGADKIRDDMNTDGIDVLQEQVAALTARVDALEAYDVTPQQS